MSQRRLNIFDRSWLLMQSDATPMHVGGLVTFALPNDASDDFLTTLVRRFREERAFAAPWNLRLRQGLSSSLIPSWVEEPDLDLDHHFRHSALPQPGGERELGILIERLHSNPLDLKRPLWEIHLIEGLERDRFALYFKIHHSVIDGVSGMRLVLKMLSDDPQVVCPAPWTVGPDRSRPRSGGPRLNMSAVTGLVQALTRVAASQVGQSQLVAPYVSPHSQLAAPMNAQRRFATQQVPLDLVQRAAEHNGATVNDIVLWLSGTALRRFLLEGGQLPANSLTAAVPVSLRKAEDNDIGTNIASLYVALGTNVADPQQRLQYICASAAAAKAHLKAIPEESLPAYLAVTTAPFVLGQITRLDGLLPPMFSVAISNVPGPKMPLHLDGARMEALFPISLLMRGGALNITCVSYDGTLDFGFTGARDALPHLQRMAVHLGEAANDLESLTRKAVTT